MSVIQLARPTCIIDAYISTICQSCHCTPHAKQLPVRVHTTKQQDKTRDDFQNKWKKRVLIKLKQLSSAVFIFSSLHPRRRGLMDLYQGVIFHQPTAATRRKLSELGLYYDKIKQNKTNTWLCPCLVSIICLLISVCSLSIVDTTPSHVMMICWHHQGYLSSENLLIVFSLCSVPSGSCKNVLAVILSVSFLFSSVVLQNESLQSRCSECQK